MERNRKIDFLKGVLILFVVVAHYNAGFAHDIIFLFHMPLFFILSGILLQKEKVTDISYIRRRAVAMLIPYICYLLLDLLIIRRDFTLSGIAHLLWGGRAISGTYWYVTCFIATLMIFSFVLKYFNAKIIGLIIASGGIAILESHLSEHIHFLKSLGIPWNADVALLAVVYLAIGFYYKEQIECCLDSDSRKYDVIALAVALLLVCFCVFNYWNGRRLYYFDMKPVYYKELISAVIIPCAFGAVLCRLVYWIASFRFMKCIVNAFAYLGRMTIPIMFMHVPLNTWQKELGYGRFMYVLIGICVPVVFTAIFCRFKTMRVLFGLPKI